MLLSRIFSLRNALVGVSVLLLAALIYALSFSVWATRNLVDSEVFASATVNALTEESSREVLAAAAIRQLVEAVPAFEVVSDRLTDAVADLLANEQVRMALLAVGTKLHSVLFDGSSEGLVVDFSQLRERIVEFIEGVAPRLVPLVPDPLFESIEIVAPGTVPELSPVVEKVQALMWAALFALIVVGGLVVWRSPSNSVALMVFGSAVTLSGLVTALLVPGGRALTVGQANDPGVEVLMVNLYDELIGGLKLQSRLVLLLGVGLLVAAVLLRRNGQARADSTAQTVTE